MSPRARFDQPKAFRLPATKKSDSDDECGVRNSNFLKVAQEHSRLAFAKSRVAERYLSRGTELSNVSLLTSPSPQKLTGRTTVRYSINAVNGILAQSDSDGQEGQSWSKMSVASRQTPSSISPAKAVKGKLMEESVSLMCFI